MDDIWQGIVEYAPPIIGVVLLLVVAYVASGWVGRLVGRLLSKAKVEQTLCRFFGSMARWALMVLALIACLGVFGVETTSFAAVLGAATLAIGLGFQGSLSNLAAGVMLLIFRPFKVGDVVQVSGELGKVAELGLFSTEMDTFDNRRIILPNSGIFGSTVVNFTHHATRRVDIPVGVEYPADLDRTREVLTAAAAGVPKRLEDPPPQIILLKLGNSSVDWQVRVWVKTEDYWDVVDAGTRAVKMALDEAGLGIPFPQMDVHLDAPVPQPV